MVPLKYLSNFWSSLEMPLINGEVNHILTSTYVISNSTGLGTFTITDTKLYVPVVTLLTQDNAKLLQQLKYQSKISTEAQNQHLHFLINPSFQRVNILFVLSFANENERTSDSNYYLSKVEIRDYNFKIDGRNFFDQPINNSIETYENIIKIATGQGDD